MNTKQANLKTNKEDILNAINLIVEPIANTMSPKGSNVLFRDEQGNPVTTNDGATIAQYIKPKDELSRIIVDSIVAASKQTESEAGDATSTTVLLTGNILKLFIEGEYEKNEFIDSLVRVKDLFIKELEKIRIGGNGIDLSDDELHKVAYVSANNNKEIADLTVDVVGKAGEYGSIVFDVNSSEPNVKFDEGFIIPSAVGNSIFMNKGSYVDYEEMAVFITDDTLFFSEDLNIIIEGALRSGIKDILIVSNNFQAKTPEVLMKVQQDNNDINVLPLQIESKDVIHDLGGYLRCPVYTRSLGRVKVDTIGDYIGGSSKVGGNMQLIVIDSIGDSMEKQERIELIKSLDQTEDTKRRLASMTSGIVTLSVGGDTQLERIERKLRFEDSILATQKAMVYGYLPGGGSAMLNSYYGISIKYMDKENKLFNKITETIGKTNIKQIFKNCGIDFYIPHDINLGLNANTGEVVDMKEAGIYDSYKAVEQSLLNAVSTSVQLISAMSNTIIINDLNE